MMMITALLVAALFQAPSLSASGVVVDPSGLPVRGAVVTVTSNGSVSSATTSDDGTWTASTPAGAETVSVRVSAPGFSSTERVVKLPAASLTIQLRPAAIAEEITVSADASQARLAIESSVTTLDRAAIAEAPALRLDDQLRTVPGFSLFRRTSSAVANPTTQGVTLRGLSASGASRTLVIADDVPLNDPFGAWVYWDRVPVAALQRVDVLRGSSGDVHGNDALGGVIRLTTRTTRGAELWLDGGAAQSGRVSGYAAMSPGAWTMGISAEHLTTDGYRVVAPEARGPIDVNADSRATSTLGWVGGRRGSVQGTLRGGYFDEDRGNGTPAQLNTTITRWGGGSAHGFVGGGVWEARGDVSSTNYHQTFSAVATGRATERLTSLQWVGAMGGGAGVSWIRQGHRFEGLVAYNGRASAADLDEAAFSLAGELGPTGRTSARKRGDGVIGQLRFVVSPRISVDGGVRVDYWRLTNDAAPDSASKIVFMEPRAGVTFRITDEQTLRGSWLSGFRTPTMNELYRSFRVGNTNTQANALLEPEESFGPEIAYTLRLDRWTARAILYATRLDGAIYNRTLSATPTAILRQRDNGDARTVGSELEAEVRATRNVSLTTAWAFNDATFTSGDLDGRRVPQVPRASGSFGVRAVAGAFAAAANVRLIGEQYDDDLNQLLLRRGSLVDARAAWRWTPRAEIFAAVENGFDEELDTGLTPIRTVGGPRLWRAGVVLKY